ncbi:unnamed protein product [Calypogeia fissa]
MMPFDLHHHKSYHRPDKEWTTQSSHQSVASWLAAAASREFVSLPVVAVESLCSRYNRFLPFRVSTGKTTFDEYFFFALSIDSTSLRHKEHLCFFAAFNRQYTGESQQDDSS